MKRFSPALESNRGFTLVELLVVIAIIGILAGMVVPNVTRWIRKARVTASISDIRNIETSLTGMLADGGRQNFRDFLTQGGRNALDAQLAKIYEPVGATVQADATDAITLLQTIYNQMFYELIRNGRVATDTQIIATYNADPGDDFDVVTPGATEFFDRDVINKLGPSYMDLGLDSWGNQYNFWIPPRRNQIMLHRSYRAGEEPAAAGDTYLPYFYNAAAAGLAAQKIPGQPAEDDTAFAAQFGAFPFPVLVPATPAFAFGFPASRSKTIFVSSLGPNQFEDGNLLVQLERYAGDVDDLDLIGGGDDVNNWDSENGWEFAPQE